nr:MAG TPA: Bacterial TniB protein [Caudoviricetes sp.]
MPAWPPLCLPSVVLPSQSTAAGKTKLLRTFCPQ